MIYINNNEIKKEIFNCIIEGKECSIVELKNKEFALVFKYENNTLINIKNNKRIVIENLIETINRYKIINESLMKIKNYENEMEELNSIVIRYSNYQSQLEKLI